MKQRSKKYRAFRRIFTFLVGAALLLLVWQLTHRPPAPSRAAWPPPANP
jgi:hypothetical protein